MMISTKGRYALRIMVDVAQHDGEMPVSVREIAQRQDISGKYMEQIISVLTRSGLLRSIRGAQGGLSPGQEPRADHRRHDPARDGGRSRPGRVRFRGWTRLHAKRRLPSHAVFSKVYSAINSVIDGVTLCDLIPEGESASAGHTGACL